MMKGNKERQNAKFQIRKLMIDEANKDPTERTGGEWTW